jgi:hypothetical protein
MDFPKTLAAKEGLPLAAFHIAYVAMGLTIWQGGWQRRFSSAELTKNVRLPSRLTATVGQGFFGLLSHQGESKKE